MRAVEGSLLVVDASQGVEAQTLANVYHAIEADHEIVPVLNKIDLPPPTQTRCPNKSKTSSASTPPKPVHDLCQNRPRHPRRRSRQSSTRLPAPTAQRGAPLKAMLVDSWYDAYLGVVVLVRIIDGQLQKGDKIRMMNTNGRLPRGTYRRVPPEDGDQSTCPGPGEMGFPHRLDQTGRATPALATRSRPRRRAAPKPSQAFAPAQPVVFCGLFPVDNAQFEDLREAIAKLSPQRRILQHRNGNIRRAGLWLSLRLPWPLAPRGDPRPPRTRIRHRTDHHRAIRDLSHPHARRRNDRTAQPRRHARPHARRPHRGTAHQGHNPRAR